MRFLRLFPLVSVFRGMRIAFYMPQLYEGACFHRATTPRCCARRDAHPLHAVGRGFVSSALSLPQASAPLSRPFLRPVHIGLWLSTGAASWAKPCNDFVHPKSFWAEAGFKPDSVLCERSAVRLCSWTTTLLLWHHLHPRNGAARERQAAPERLWSHAQLRCDCHSLCHARCCFTALRAHPVCVPCALCTGYCEIVQVDTVPPGTDDEISAQPAGVQTRQNRRQHAHSSSTAVPPPRGRTSRSVSKRQRRSTPVNAVGAPPVRGELHFRCMLCASRRWPSPLLSTAMFLQVWTRYAHRQVNC